MALTNTRDGNMENPKQEEYPYLLPFLRSKQHTIASNNTDKEEKVTKYIMCPQKRIELEYSKGSQLPSSDATTGLAPVI